MLTDRSRRALSLCSSLAIATALLAGSGSARAQSFTESFQGTGTVVSGGATITTGTNATNIDINGTNSDVVIDWSTFDIGAGGGPINFQPAGTTATFQSTNAQFTALNRILPTDPTRQVQFNGTVIGQLQGAASQTPAGSVYFYSPGGLVIGSTAVFNVGNLGLTSAAPVVDGTGCFDCNGAPPGGGRVIFSAANSGTGVDIQAGAQITGTSPAPGNYVAIVAPKITNAGSISGKRVTALVSADAATMTIDVSGLFDIQVDSGTSATGTTLFNSGSITGPAGDAGNVSRIYLVAVPKNQAITMAIASGSTLGFDVADAADVVGNTVVLSGGHDVFGGSVSSVPSIGAGSGTVALAVGNAAFTSATTGSFTGQADVFASSGGSVSFASNLTLQSDGNIQAFADGAASSLSVGGAVSFDVTRAIVPQGASASGNASTLGASNGASVSVTGAVTINANGVGGSSATSGLNGGNGLGGQAQLGTFQGGSISVGGLLSLNANGVGGQATVSGATGGMGTGGLAQIYHDQAGTISLNSGAQLSAQGFGGSGSAGGAAGVGQGGSARANLYNTLSGSSSGSIAITGNLGLQAGGVGGNASSAAGGAGSGGDAFINVSNAGGTQLSVTGNAQVNAAGRGGDGAGGGLGTAGTAGASALDGNTLQVGGNLDVFAIGTGGNGGSLAAGSGQGGSSFINGLQGGQLTVGGNAQSFALGLSGAGNGAASTATGGIAQATAQQNSTLNVGGFLNVAAGGITSDPASGLTGQGAGVGGTARVSALTGGSINVTAALRARAPATATSNRNAVGGTVDVQAFTGGVITANELNVQVNGLGGNDTGSGAGSGTGGIGRLTVDGPGSRIAIANGNTTGNVATGDLDFITAQGIGGQNNGGGSNVGGAGFGGSAAITVTNGATLSGPATVGSPGFVRIVPRATGGNASAAGGTGGAATGGTIDIVVDNASFTSADLLPSSFALGGSATASATGVVSGGNAVGGTRNITVRNGGTLTTAFSGGGPGAQGGDGTLSGRGGDASGGSASLFVDNGTLTLTGRGIVFSQNASGAGGTAGNVTAGTANARVSAGGVINVFDDLTSAADLSITANAFGAFALASPGIAQGTVTAGTATLLVQNGTINGSGSILVAAEANAQSDQYAQGGTYQGGQANVFLQGGTIAPPQILVSANADAAEVGAGLNGTGGNATGGFAQFQSSAGTTGVANVTVEARGLGGNLLGTGTAGNGTGGRANIGTNTGATLNVSGAVSLTADGTGGSDIGTGGSGVGGLGTGGMAELGTFMGGSLNLSGALDAFARGFGGNTTRTGFAAGSGIGGIAQIYHDTMGTIALASNVNLNASGSGGTALLSGVAGALGRGGEARTILYNPGTATLTIGGTLFADASGQGSAGNNADGGAGQGGNARIGADAAGKTISVTGAATLISSGFGGNSAAAQAGAGTGGFSTVNSTDSTVRLQGGVSQFAHGSAGANLAAGAGGAGIGGGARIETFGTSGLIAITGNATLSAASFGGASSAGAGGNAGQAMNTGAAIRANAGAITVSGGASIDARATGGGGGAAGGNAQGGFANVRALGGDVTIGNGLTTDASAFGGDGTTGGNATGGTSTVDAGNGDLLTTDFVGDASAEAGNGGSGGSGGNATAGGVFVIATSVAAGPSTVQMNSASLTADAFGGSGGAGATLTGAVGGAGGNATAGNVQLFGSAGNGKLTVGGDALLSAEGFGGSGGNGADASGSAGGMGGAAGSGTGGQALAGTFSGTDIPALTGSASLADVTLFAEGFGGTGGGGGSGTTGGSGGNGGAAFGGAATLQSRGVLTTYATATLAADSFGGNGGPGSTAGVGGNATVGDAGGIGVFISNRFNHLDQPGSLSGGDIVATAIASGGAGSTAGTGFVGDSVLNFVADHATATISNLSLIAGGDQVTSSSPSVLTLTSATVGVPGSMTVATPGLLAVSLDSATLNVGNLTLSAGNFVLPAVRPATLGTINVSNALSLSSTLDFLAYANFNVGFAGSLSTGGSILAGDLIFGGPLDIAAGGSITTGNIQAADVALAAGTTLATGAVTTGGSIDLVAAGTITTGQLTAGDTVEADAGGVLTIAGASAGIVNPSTNPLAEYNVGLRSQTSVVAGDVAARANFGVSSPGSIAVGNVNVGLAFLALPGTSLTTGSITTANVAGARVYIANNSMEALGGQITSNFDPAPIFATAPVATGGPITISGPISTTILQANTQQSLNISGAITAPGVAVLIAGTTLGTADITVGDRTILAAGGNITLGNVNAGITIPSGGLRKIAIGSSTGTVATGNVAAGFDLGIQAGGGISTGTLMGRQILLLAGSNVSTGPISAVVGTQPIGQVYVGNFSMANSASNVFLQFQSPTTGPLPIFALDPVRTGGSITFGGAVQAGNVSAAAGQAFTASAITAGNYIRVDAGGLASINGAWRSPSIDVVSGDIAIAATGSLDGLSATGEVLLASTNANGMFVGDGLAPGSGYALSNDEYSRVRAGEVDVVVTDIAGLATDLTVGTLTINASQLYGANGVALFASGDRTTQTPSGIVRIAGAVTATGFAPTTEIDLLSGTVEIETVSGSLKVDSGSPGSLGGLVFIDADNIHVASAPILTKLRADPLYAGHIDELNAPAATQRPDGVLNALGFEISIGKTFYVQNTGTRAVPAGFLTTFDNTDVFASTPPPTGGVEIVINGQFQTSTGTVTGKAAFDQIIADPTPDSEQFAGFSSNSQINGCVFLSGICTVTQSDPVAALSSEITVVTNATLDESPVAPAADDADEGEDVSSDKDDEDSKSDEGSSPIAPPTPLISTRALDGEVNVVEPVSGAGNPALFGSAVDEATVQGEKP
ncbi:hypothetical protein [Novosphingobium sp. Gsoil 351]|uniref:hypothetical protein n=1 Tax=Novosphingobium sp. Gsoil 351 TaxID=2675225 RepID=UPI0012B4EA12|nr:hypothetical protein [Novosphingobium sp. Gsoil 351]QGN53475.1 hypothetical protein GKE62_01855 [Novosphingobium sp. Gsoil 351]